MPGHYCWKPDDKRNIWRTEKVIDNSGHGSFSNNGKLNSVVGHLLHSSIFVPYHGWYFQLSEKIYRSLDDATRKLSVSLYLCVCLGFCFVNQTKVRKRGQCAHRRKIRQSASSSTLLPFFPPYSCSSG
ncbi:hypothetical protein L6452_40740 [Arctium lappa]|uniref:Uncharacterized protein n=1 Tax=Arctium lappa TaxID=4217 RepID=A0ACB8XNX4_ARCLA|nr:hypothetical protein L6452_40740 [Arctium lappa]